MSIETTTSDSTANDQNNDDETEALPNPERGCGYLKDGKAYLRADVSADGDLPAFVEFDQPIPFKENRKRSYKQFPGVQFELSVTGEAGLTTTTPANEIQNHLDRLMADRPTGTTAGEMVSFHSNDLLMSVGKTHYETADEFAAEAKVHGVNKAISVTSGNEPPVVNPGRTRLFLIHPRAVEVSGTEMEEQEVEQTEEVALPNGDTKTVSYTETEMVEVETTNYVPGVFGYTYLTRVVYTEDADGNIPKYIQDYEATGSLDVVETADPTPFSEQEGFDAEGNALPAEQETMLDIATDDAEPIDLQEMYPALEAPDIDEMEKADLGSLAEQGEVEGHAPPVEQDALHGADDGALAVVKMDGETYKVMPSNNMSYDERSESASSVVGPYRLDVEDRAPFRVVTVERTR